MGIRISVEICSGNRDVTDDDIRRAEDAALRILDRSGRSVGEIYAEFRRQWAEVDDYRQLTEDGLRWLVAENAANNALRKGWHGPHIGMCHIEPRSDHVEIMRALLDAGAQFPGEAA